MSDLPITNRLFVYGTLRQMDSTGKNALLGRSIYLGEGTIEGILLDLGEYPGAIDDSSSHELIIGEVYELENFTQQIVSLDKYEGCDLKTPLPHEYRRELVTVLLNNKQRLSAWVYWYLGAADNIKIIASGNWLAP